MKKKDLIKALKEIPGNPDVFYSHHDNTDYETAGETFSVSHVKKSDFNPLLLSPEDREAFLYMPDEWAVIRG